MNKTTRWIPAIAVPVIVVAGAVAIPAMADSNVTLPAKSASQIAALVAKSKGVSFSGTVSTTANLGLPSISASDLGGSSSSTSSVESTLAQLTGTHSAKVFVDGTSAFRLQTLDNLAERDVVAKGSSVWTYDSQSKSATHLTLPASSGASALEHSDAQSQAATPTPDAPVTARTPGQIASSALAKFSSYTNVTTGSSVKIAGQKAYEIVLTPKNHSTTLVGSVTLAVDATTGVPLKASITAAGAKSPAYEVAFTSISYTKPSSSVFDFTAPKGTKVTTETLPAQHSTQAHPGALTQESATARAEKKAKVQAAWAKYSPTVIGTGWSSVVEATLPADSTKDLSGSSTGGTSGALLDNVLTKVAGGRVLQTSLVSIYLTDSGKVLIGAVPASALEAAAAK